MKHIHTRLHRILLNSLRELIADVLQHHWQHLLAVWSEACAQVFRDLLNEFEGGDLALKSTCVHGYPLLSFETLNLDSHASLFISVLDIVGSCHLDVDLLLSVLQ